MLFDWVYGLFSNDLAIDLGTATTLTYVRGKGSFRFDVRGLAKARFDRVRGFAVDSPELPGAVAWLDRNRRRLDNKYHASKFYLLAVVLPWLASRRERAVQPADRTREPAYA